MSNILKMLEKDGVMIRNGHFVGTSGVHMSTYINKNRIICDTELISKIGREFAKKFKSKKIQVVVSPAVAGIAFGQWTAYFLSKITKKKVFGVFTEKDNENQIFKRGYESLVKNKRVLIVEDVTTKGISIKKVIRAVRKARGEVIVATCLVNRDSKAVNSKTLGVSFEPLVTLDIPSYSPKECPLCYRNMPISKILGHGKK